MGLVIIFKYKLRLLFNLLPHDPGPPQTGFIGPKIAESGTPGQYTEDELATDPTAIS